MNITVPRKRNGQEGFTLVELMIVVAIIGILAVLAVVGYGWQMTNAKSAEARGAVGNISKLAVAAAERERTDTTMPTPGGVSGNVTRGLCTTAAAVPDGIAKVRNKKYQSAAADWAAGTTANDGWRCLGFAMTEPQAFQYGYVSDSGAASRGTGYSAWAASDLKDDGAETLSFELKGAYSGSQLVVQPQMDEIKGAPTKTIGVAAGGGA